MIKIEGLTKTYGEFVAVDNLSFEIPDGVFLGLLGPNGAGKTTLVKMMIGLYLPTDGQIVYDGTAINRDSLKIKQKLGVVSQHLNLDKELTVKENMIFAGKLYKMNRRDIETRTAELFQLLNLEKIADRQVRKLSGGMKRKLMIAKALIHSPTYLFLDEPTVGIDVMTRREIRNFLRGYHQAGNTVILTTHYIEEAESLSQMILLINKGQIFKKGSCEDLIGEIGAFKVVGGQDIQYFDTLGDAKSAVTALDGLVRVANTTLEDVFFYYTNEVNEWGS